MDFIVSNLQQFGWHAAAFVVVLGIVVFVHEFGHFWVARRSGVRVETFSIGFGPEIVAWFDKHGTRWRLAWLPFGGYVKMFGDADPSSFGPDENVLPLAESEKKFAFYTQPVRKRFAIVAAGPLANYIFGVIVLALLFMVNGQGYTSTKIETVVADGAGAAAGLVAGDVIQSIDGKTMESFEQIKRTVALNLGTPVEIVFERDGTQQTITATPKVIKTTDRLGGEHQQGVLGIISKERAYRDLGPLESIRESFVEVGSMTTSTLKGLGQMIMGTRSTDELGGPLRIAQLSGKVAKDGVYAFFWFVAVISINLGLINLFPIPLLDGGHLFFYSVEGLRGRPLGERMQEYSARAGFTVIMFLMVFATWNDLVQFKVVSYIRGLFS